MLGRKPTSVLLLPIVALALLGAYVGSYYATVVPKEYWTNDPHIGVVTAFYSRDWDVNSRWQTFFTPIHWLDRRIRPHVWEPPQ